MKDFSSKDKPHTFTTSTVVDTRELFLALHPGNIIQKDGEDIILYSSDFPEDDIFNLD